VLAMVTTASRDYAESRCRGRRVSGRVRSCDNASSGACEVRAATSRPRSGGSGLYAPPRGHDQGRARGRWPRGAPVRLARLEGSPSGPIGCGEAGAEAQMLIQGRCWAVLGSAHRCASLVGSAYDVGLSGRVPVGGERCRERGAPARPRPRSSGMLIHAGHEQLPREPAWLWALSRQRVRVDYQPLGGPGCGGDAGRDRPPTAGGDGDQASTAARTSLTPTAALSCVPFP